MPDSDFQPWIFSPIMLCSNSRNNYVSLIMQIFCISGFSAGYGFGYGYPDSQRNPYYNPRSGIRSRGSQDRNSQRKNSNNSAKNNNTNSTLELHESSPLEQVEPVSMCIEFFFE